MLENFWRLQKHKLPGIYRYRSQVGSSDKPKSRKGTEWMSDCVRAHARPEQARRFFQKDSIGQVFGVTGFLHAISLDSQHSLSLPLHPCL